MLTPGGDQGIPIWFWGIKSGSAVCKASQVSIVSLYHLYSEAVSGRALPYIHGGTPALGPSQHPSCDAPEIGSLPGIRPFVYLHCKARCYVFTAGLNKILDLSCDAY